MNKKISKIWGVGLTLVLAASMLLMAAPVSAGTLSWGTETIPSDSGKVIQLGTDVVDLAVAGDGTTIYAAAPFVRVATLWAESPNTATWSATEKVSGGYSAKLTHEEGFNRAYVQITPQTGITLAEFVADPTDYGFDYHLAVAGNLGPQYELYFTDGALGKIELTCEAALYDVPGTAAWLTKTLSGAEQCQWFGTDASGDALTPPGLVTLATFLTDADYTATAAFELTRVRIDLGWGGDPGKVSYIDDVTIDGTTYNLEAGYEGDVAADGFALSGNIYKSTNAGETWSGLTNPAASSVGLVAVAPDDEDTVAIVADNGAAYVSQNGGTSWDSLGTNSATNLYDIAISPESAGKHYIAVAGTDSLGKANVWYFQLGAVGAWKETKGIGNFTPGSVASAVAFSPNFASDQVMVAVTFDTLATIDYVRFQMFSMNQKLWNSDAGFGSYPVTITSATTPLTYAGITSASISLAPEYLGSDDAMRVAFVGLDILSTITEDDGIYRLKNTSVKKIKEGEDIHSVAFDGTNLVAGQGAVGNAIYRSDDPLATTPDFSTTSSLKRPGGDSKVVVAWAGTDVVAGTSGEESAFAVSRDEGQSFNDLSLIDTTISTLEDVAVSADGSVVYLATNDGNDFSLWRSASSWERVLSVLDKKDFIVRLAPKDADVVYVVDKGTKTIYYTTTGGNEKWFTRTCRYEIQDMAVESSTDAYIGVAGTATVSKTTNSGFTWQTSKSTSLGGGYVHTIASLGEDLVIVGSTTGYVSYSTDGNSSWTKISKVLSETGLTQVIASGLDSGDFIYAATAPTKADTATLVERWEIGESTSWKDMAAPTTVVTVGAAPTAVAEYGAYGIALQDGVLYIALEDDAAPSTPASRIARTLGPTADSVGWSTMDKAVKFATTPSALRVSTADSNKLWAIGGVDLYSYIDTLATVGPAQAAPSQGAEVKINPVSGKSYDVSYTWERPSKAIEYQLVIALDYDFAEVVMDIKDIASTSATVSKVVGPGALAASLEYMPEVTYYWKVRADSDGPIYSPWSAIRMFTIGALPEIQPPVEIIIPPAPPAPQIVLPPTPAPVPAPEIIFQTPPPPPDIVIPPAPAPPAPITPAFIWAIVIIGAILVIAVVVLIVRTRRVA